ncbi:MAG: sigma-54 dependent transcriptional regulator [Candidatus Krumholzibacteria bacterium]|nr:sigma-54 dependent transcriptional regulator [Candidatus Krumholzibacteria bacterium]MDH4335736.1 sigma-54 dependent transcriptional regulator [Candidatus Krumholzibacteria bacterium]MDH5269262.1 sigma-54 dependent transcriptional regulator [Candidatus Krumholzibacteria bacterium]
MIRVLIVDDVRNLADQYAYDLKRMGGFETRVATSGKEALDLIAWDPVDCVILDLEMPGIDGFEVLRTMDREGHGIPVIVYTGTGNYDRCVQAVRLGAAGFIDKSEPMARVVHEVETALERARLREEVKSLRGDADTALIGTSAPARALAQHIARVAAIPSTVLIVGESGTGKEVVARELHRLGPHPEGPFVAVNSAALPDNLVESELFGHERGAFTGANRTHRGAFERASGGTLFLDEIGELPAAVQAKLLRVLEQNEITRVGGEQSIKVAARVIAATHRDLEADVDAGRFRRDLFFRINVHLLPVPPLADRRSDIPELANHFLTATCASFKTRRKHLDREALEALMAYDWHRNNVRELRNAVERMVLATDGAVITLADVPADIRPPTDAASPPSGATSFRDRKLEAERQIVVGALEAAEWNVTRAAADLGLADHASLQKIMRRLGIRRPR